MAGSDGERNSGKHDASENGVNGKNGKHMNVETPAGENSVERSLEDFIARANSTFTDAEDGWDLSEEKVAPAPEPVVRARGTQAPPVAAEVQVEAALPVASLPGPAAAVPAPVAIAEASGPVVPTAPILVTGATENTQVVARAHVPADDDETSPSKRRSMYPWIIAAFLGGSAVMYFVIDMRMSGRDRTPETPAAVAPVAAPEAPVVEAKPEAPAPVVAPAPAPAPTPTVAEVPAPAPAAPAPVEVKAPAPVAAPAVTAIKPAPAPSSEPVVQPLQPAASNEPKVEPLTAPAPVAAKGKPAPAKPAGAAKPAASKIADPFGDEPAAKPAAAPGKAKGAKGGKTDGKAEKAKPGIVDPF